MSSIANKSKKENNIGGVWYAIFLPMRWITSMPAMNNGFISVGSIVPVGGHGWMRIDFVDKTGIMKWQQKLSAEGIVYDCVLEGAVAKDLDMRYEEWIGLQNEELAIVVVDNNRKARLLGYFDTQLNKKGARVLVDFSEGKRPDELNSFELKFSIKQPFPPRPAFYSALAIDTSSLPPEPNPPIDVAPVESEGFGHPTPY